MKPTARIISGTIEGALKPESGKQIELKHCIVGTLNMQMGFVISVMDREGKIKCMLSNPEKTMELSEETDISAMQGMKIEGVISNNGWKRFKGVILEGYGGIYIEVAEYQKKQLHNPGLTKVIMIPETMARYHNMFKKG